MQIVNFRKFDGPTSARGFRCVGKFAVDINADIRIFDWQLIETPDGEHLAYAPGGIKGAVISMSPGARTRVAKLAEIEMKRANDNDRHTAAAA
jgi:hypothetical protein